MAITLSSDATKRLQASIKRDFAEHLNEDIGDLKAALMLAIADAQAYFDARVMDLEGVCHEPEFSYWKARP
jgi:hypothetical protein